MKFVRAVFVHIVVINDLSGELTTYFFMPLVHLGDHWYQRMVFTNTCKLFDPKIQSYNVVWETNSNHCQTCSPQTMACTGFDGPYMILENCCHAWVGLWKEENRMWALLDTVTTPVGSKYVFRLEMIPCDCGHREIVTYYTIINFLFWHTEFPLFF